MITTDSGDFFAKPTLSNAFAQKKAPEQVLSVNSLDDSTSFYCASKSACRPHIDCLSSYENNS
jgi:hypothetical protein